MVKIPCGRYQTKMKYLKFNLLATILIILCLIPLSLKADTDQLIIETFSQGADEKGVPIGWELKEKEGTPIIRLEKEKDTSVLHLISERASFGLTKEIRVNLKEYPYLNFRWKAEKIPKNGDFRKKETDDQAAQIYVVFGTFKLTAKIVGYLWENTLPKFTTGVSPAWGKTRLIVLQSGTENIGTWIWEKRNLYNDYKALFGEEPPEANLISIYINSQHTQSLAESYFGNIYFSKK
jgi:hypothetical protein